MPKAGDYRQRVEQGYDRNPVVAACISLRAVTLSEAPLAAWRNESYDMTHPLALLMRRPNPTMSYGRFIAAVSTMLDIGGNVYLYKERNSIGAVVALWPYSAALVVPIFNDIGYIVGYQYSAQGTKITWSLEDVVHLRHPAYIDASDPYLGRSPLESAWGDVELYNELLTTQYNVALALGVPPGVFQVTPTPGATATDSEGMVRQLQAQWLNRIFGNRRERTKPMVLEGVTWQAMGQDARAMQITESIKNTEAAICGAFGVHTTIAMTRVGMDASTYNNLQEGYRQYTTLTRIPWWKSIAEQLEVGLSHEYQGVQLAFDESKVASLQEDPDAIINPVLAKWNANLIDANEARGELGLAPWDDERGEMLAYEMTAPAGGGFFGDEIDEPQDPAPARDDDGQSPVAEVLERNAEGMATRIRWNESFAVREWRAVDASIRDAVKELELAAVEMIDEFTDIAVALAEDGDRAMLRKLDNRTIQDLLEGFLRASRNARSRLLKRVLDKAVETVGGDFTVIESSYDRIQTEAQREVTAKVKESLGTLQKDVSKVLEANQGLSSDAMATTLRERLTTLTPSRAQAIARTTARAQATATQTTTWEIANEQAPTKGDELVKVWISQRDSKVRPSHEDMDGMVIDMPGAFTFSDGTTTLGPGEGGSAGNAINCRCTLAAVRRRDL
jgi:HK97 family phage portal protein